MPKTVKCSIVNDTDFNLTSTDIDLNYKLESGDFAAGTTAPPCPIAAHATAEFSTSTSSGGGPAGWVCYWLDEAKAVVQIIWADTAGDNGFKIGLNVLNGGTRDIDPVAVEFTDASGGALTYDQAKTSDSFVAKYTVRLTPASPSAPAAPGGGAVAATPDGNTPVATGSKIPRWDDQAITQPRKRVLASIGALFPMSWKMAKQAAPRGQGTFRLLPWSDDYHYTSCTSVNPQVMNIAAATSPEAKGWAFAIYNSPAWVPFAKDKLPNVGDIYMLYVDEDATDGPHSRHVGFVLQVPASPTDPWVTGDGGQRDSAKSQCAILVPRPWKWDLPSTSPSKAPHAFAKVTDGLKYPYLGGGAESGGMSSPGRLIGWLDMDHASIKFANGGAFDAEGSDTQRPALVTKCMESDYKSLGTRIQTVITNKDNY